MYAVIQFINGAFTIQFESDNLDSLKYNYHNWCALLWNDTGAVNGVVKIVDSNLDVVEGYIEFINHEAKNA